MTELKPCPFCGGKVKRKKNMIVCHDCEYVLIYEGNKYYDGSLGVDGGRYETMEAAWNKRKGETEMKEYNLKPCPFCGGEAILKHVTDSKYGERAFVTCKKCTSRTIQIKTSTEYNADDKAVALWNRRVEDNDA